MGNEIELSSVITDIAAGPFGSNLKVECFVPYGFPIIDGANLKGYKVTDNLTKFVTEEKARSLSRSIARRGDVVVTISGTLGQIAYIPEDSIFEEYLCSQRQFRVSFDTSQVYVPYLVFYFHTFEGQNKILSFANQTGVPALSQPLKNFKKIRLCLPDYRTQKKIASIIEAFNDKIECNQKINENLLQQLDALYQELSTRDTWDITPIGDLAEKIAMGPFGSNIKVSTFVPYGVPIISGNHLRGYFLEEPSYNYITEEHAEKLKNSVVYPGDVVFTHAGNIGQVAMIPNGCDYPRYVLSQRQFYLRCNTEKLIPEYVTLFFHSKEGQHELLSYANQTGVPSIAQPASNLKKISLPVPPLQIQEDWADLVRPIIAQYQQNKLEIRALSTMRDTLLPKLMSGKIDVSNIQL